MQDWLLQRDWRDNVIPNMHKQEWIRVFHEGTTSSEARLSVYCALAPKTKVSSILEIPKWDIQPHDAAPGFYQDHKYYRTGFSEHEMEPLIIERDFEGLKPRQIEIAEEFRLFHNLYHDRAAERYVKFDEGGNETEVIKYSENEVKVRRKAIRQYLAAKDMSLVIYFVRGVDSDIGDPDIALYKCQPDQYCYRFSTGVPDLIRESDSRVCSRLVGKRIIKGLPREKCGIYPYEGCSDPITLGEFEVALDDNEEPVLGSSALFYGGPRCVSNREPPQAARFGHLTPVFFRREVLQKYYDRPKKYTVQNGSIKCGNTKWRIDIDTDHEQYVIAFLGDLGRDLPHTEHNHWKAHNVPPDGQISEARLQTWFPETLEDALYPTTEDSSFLFRQSFTTFGEACYAKSGWDLFKPLREEDAHHFTGLRRPLTQEPSELDEIMLSLSILLVDSINVKKLKKLIPDFKQTDERGRPKLGITVFEEYLRASDFEGTEGFIACLRKVQQIRSTSAAHRKGDKYDKAAEALGLDHRPPRDIADDIFNTLTEFLDSLRAHFCSDDGVA